MFAHFLVDGQEVLGAVAAGLLVRLGGGELEVLTTTSHRVSDLEAYQAQQKTGPCADAVATGEYVFESGTDTIITRWPGLAGYLAGTPYQAVQAHPMRWHGQVLGAINFFYPEPVADSADRLTVGQAFADMATLILLTPTTSAAPTSPPEPVKRWWPGLSWSRPRAFLRTSVVSPLTRPTRSSSTWPATTE